VIVRLALRSLTTRPLRSAVLAAGFGLGIGVMVELLGVGQVVLEQAHAPALQGGGDVVIGGSFSPLGSARFVLSHVLGGSRLRERVAGAAPSRHATLFLITPRVTLPVSMRGGIPSLEKAIGDPEVADQTTWRDEPGDAAWRNPPPGDVLRAMDRFHPIPREHGVHTSPGAAGFDGNSWAEWLYFNGRTADGQLRFYLSFIAGGINVRGTRTVTVRLQLDRQGRSTNYAMVGDVDDRDLMARAPDLNVGDTHVRLEGTRYHITLALAPESVDAVGGGVERAPPSRRPQRAEQARARRPRLTGDLILDAVPGRSLPPAAIHGAQGWVSGYVVPVLAGTFHGTLRAGSETISVENAAGYHDHNWGFWDGVRWQWGQLATGDVSILFGRVFPPATVADPERIPGFLAVLGRDGPLAFSSDVSIREEDEGGSPRAIHIRATGEAVDLTLTFAATEQVRTSTFLQLGGIYTVSGRAGTRDPGFGIWDLGFATTRIPNPESLIPNP
jgi:hypothetical protein